MTLTQSYGGMPLAALILLAISLIVSSIGFRRTVLFISVGYGFSITTMALAAALLFGRSAGPLDFALDALLALYGLRLGLFIIRRDRDARFREAQAAEGWSEGGLGLKLAIWPTVALLYVAMFTPALERFARAASGSQDSLPLLSILGVLVTTGGLLLESLADAQKSAFKKLQPRRFCDTGLYRVVRSPNYFGEILVWTGSLLAGFGSITGWLAWTAAIAGYVCIVLIMIGSARRLELSQESRYGADPEYRAYVARVPILLPFVPIHSLKEAKVYLG